MTDDNGYSGLALDGPLKGRTLSAPSTLCLEKDRRWWRVLIFGPSPDFAYIYKDGGWRYDGTRSY